MSGGVEPRAIVVMGVSGCGKSTLGAALADRIGGVFLDADDLHSDEARQKMAGGTPLTDEDRAPWLDRVGDRMRGILDTGQVPIVACSALKAIYRDRLRARAGDVVFVHLDGDVDLLRERLEQRPGHFMPPGLLASQRATLEPLGPAEIGIRLDVVDPPDVLVARVLESALVAPVPS